LISKELLAQHFEYSLWASLKILEAAEKLPLDAIEKDCGNSFGGILGTLPTSSRPIACGGSASVETPMPPSSCQVKLSLSPT